MKKTLFFTFFIAISMQMSAQIIEIKARPLVFILGTYPIAAEYKVSRNISFDGELIGMRSRERFARDDEFSTKGLGFQIIGKYYPFPSKNKDLDRLSIGVYTKYSTTNSLLLSSIGNPFPITKIQQTLFSSGAHFGYKWVYKHNFLFELGGGLGRFFGNVPNFLINLQPFGTFTGDAFGIRDDLEFMGRIAFGYRFGNKTNDD